MLFNSVAFAVFFAAFYPPYLLVRKNVAARNLLLLLASYVFYGWWDPRFLILVATSTAVDYCAALGAAGKPVGIADRAKAAAFLAATAAVGLALSSRAEAWTAVLVAGGIALVLPAMWMIERAPAGLRRRLWLGLSLTCNLGILLVFKYFNFFVDTLVDTLDAIGFGLHHPALSIVLPVGLSFYTFQAISRTVDSFKGNFEPRRSLLNYAAYHAFFPQLVAGPIERAPHLMPQFESVRPLDWTMVRSGAALFVWGLYQKIVVADNVAPVADAVFNAPGTQDGAAALAGIMAFTVQIYCDFAGYSNMARGLARCLGFDLMVNFNLPYFARTPSEFWQRWHISLSRWLRDYLYVPLGGSRGSRGQTYRNLMATMLIGGLWHGAGWTFVAWGAFHGAIQVVYRALRIDALIARTDPRRPAGAAIHAAAWLATMILVMVGWTFFRAGSFADATAVLSAAASLSGLRWEAFATLAAYALPLLAVEILQRAGKMDGFVPAGGPFLLRYTAALATLLAIFTLGATSAQQFIYFNF